MNKKMMTFLLVVTHLLCILLGYCLAMIRPMKVAREEPVSSITETDTTEATEPQKAAPEEPTVEVLATEGTEATEETQSEEPAEKEPPVTQSQVTQPPVNQPSATEPPAVEPPSDGEWAPDDNETERS